MPCRENTCVKEQKHNLLSLVESSCNNIAQVIQIMHLFFSFVTSFSYNAQKFQKWHRKKTRFFQTRQENMLKTYVIFHFTDNG